MVRSGAGLGLDRGQGVPASVVKWIFKPDLDRLCEENANHPHFPFIDTRRAGAAFPESPPFLPRTFCTLEEALKVILKIGGNSNWKALRSWPGT